MNQQLTEKLAAGRLYFDGGLGSEMAKVSLSEEEQQCSALISLRHPDELKGLHLRYLQAGCDVVTTNTFTANPIKAAQYGFDLKEAIEASVRLARQAIQESGLAGKLVALDIGPSGKLLEPFGPCPFDEIYDYYGEIVQLGEAAGADVILFETFSDLYELKAGILAAKQHTSLPVLATMTLEKNYHTLTGSSPEIIAAVLESLGVEAYGFNCSLGPIEMKEPTLALLKAARLPVILQPNAGLPVMENGVATYNIDAAEFAAVMAELAKAGVIGLGGCCGTTPGHIRAVVEQTGGIQGFVSNMSGKNSVSSYQQLVFFDSPDDIDLFPIIVDSSTVDLEALESGDYSELSDLAFEAVDEESDAILLKVDAVFEDPAKVMGGILLEIQSMVKLPVILQSSQPEIIAAYRRKYNGKALVLTD